MQRSQGLPAALLALVLALVLVVSAPALAADNQANEAAELGARLAALDADPALADKGALERWKARQAVANIATVRSRERTHALTLARARTAAAEQAAQAEALQQQSAQLDRERDQILVEASRREAQAAQREADACACRRWPARRQNQRLAESVAQERAELEQDTANADATTVQATKLAEARARGGAARAQGSRAGRGRCRRLQGRRTRNIGGRRRRLAAGAYGRQAHRVHLAGTAFASGSATLAPSRRRQPARAVQGDRCEEEPAHRRRTPTTRAPRPRTSRCRSVARTR